MARLLAALAAVLALAVAAGCGGSEPVAAGGPGAAELVPATAAGYISLQTGSDAEQVERLRELAEKFPAAKSAVERMLREALDGSWQDEVEPALGDEVALVFLSGRKEPVGLTQPDDPAKLRQLVEKLDEGGDLEVRELEGWHAFGEPADLDAFASASGSGEKLSESDEWEEAFDDLPEDALVRAFGRGEALRSLAQGSIPLGAASGNAAMVAEVLEDGIRIDGRMLGGEQQLEEFEPELLDRVPDDAFLAASFANVDSMTAELRKTPIPFLPELERSLGVTLDDLGRLLGGESVLYARAGVGIPEVTLATTPDDPAAALETLRKLAGALSGFTGSELQTTQVDGIEVHVLNVEPVRIQFAQVDDAVVVTSGVTALRDFRRDGDKLGDSDRFEDAVEDAGFEGRTAGLLFFDFERALPVIDGIASLAGEELPAEARETLERLDVFTAQATAEDGGSRFGALLRTR